MKKLVYRIFVAIELVILAGLIYLAACQELPSFSSIFPATTVTESPETLEIPSTEFPTAIPAGTPVATPVATPVPTPTPVPQKLKVHQIAVGCANAYLIQYGDTAIAIDGGLDNSSTRKKVLEYIEMAGVSTLDAYIATHYHGDHTGNMDQILSAFANTDTVVYGPTENVPKAHSPLVAGTYRQMRNGDVIHFGEMKLTCVGPTSVDGNGKINNDSLNFVIELGDHKFYFTGDYVRSKDVLEQHSELIANVDVFQFPHHGLESFCISERAFKHVNPQIVLVPANSSGPSQRLAKKLGLTDKFLDNGDGNICIITDGTTLEVYTQVEPGQFAN